MSVSHLSLDEARSLVTETLIRCGTSPENADCVATGLIDAELAGQFGHGLRRIPPYAKHVLAGKVDGRVRPRAEQMRPGVLAVDAAGGFAFPALDLALDWLPDATRSQGIAMAGIYRSHHCGVAGVPVENLANQGLMAIMVANAAASMAPWGGAEPLFGTDPLAFAAPVEGAEPVVVDISLSKAAKGKIMAAAQKDEPIPEGWAVDADGNPTTDARAALKGNMLPMGDAKGTALAIMVEMLCAGLTGANYAYECGTFFEGDAKPIGSGHTIIAIDPTAFHPGAAARFADMAMRIETMEGARLPGRRRQKIREEVRRNGIEVDDRLLKSIDKLGRT